MAKRDTPHKSHSDHESTKKSKKRKLSKETIAKTATEIQHDNNQVLNNNTPSDNPSDVSQAEIDQFMTTHSIAIVDSESKPVNICPYISFDHLPDDAEEVYAPLKSFKSPTPIQSATWPLLFDGSDVIGIAETGSGKTLAFGLPCVRMIMQASQSRSKSSRPAAVIISPTRELAMQIYEQMLQFAQPASIQVACIFGGTPKEEQRKALKHAAIVVATPGRLKDLQNDGSVDLGKVKYLVLDEADRMLDKGFEQDIKDIIASMPESKRQTVMFTATWPPSVRDLANTFMSSPATVTVGGHPSSNPRANTRIKQTVEVISPREKETRLIQLLNQYQRKNNVSDKILVFCLYKKEAVRVERLIRAKGFKAAGIHGDLSQQERFKSLDAFKSGNATILVATDVAARGLDIPSVKLVINVTFPLTVEDYVHRIGRTGRAGSDGYAITLFTEMDKAQSGALINVLKAAKQEVPSDLLKFGTTVKKKQHEAYGAFFKNTDAADKPATKIVFDD
ncbi:hypothetical protein ASPZODRAFT_169616 [Penicilliopsis zonata CBS 506.65]|uniref:RNA helicase n=1 Tax=Penicilliopsis zonata CBS 506.65 TaxID=1073090 RepID=A0A1L9S847_9EURO|nr:hypothetical protein ASPZODRAFT_169616 [Penicilliopsis zonata CBS 506.65]OJJ43326.1 hypothetical protein ASPZODRAFT_169616 [Penicilliopsis zonata CBS 506.65]